MRLASWARTRHRSTAPTKIQSEPVWFSCRMDGAEGNSALTGQAVGWTGGRKTAWLVIGRDEQFARTLIEALRQAAD